MYKRYETLYKLVSNFGLGFVPTNYFPGSKAHLLQMRKEDLVDYVDGKSTRILKFNNYYYSPTPEGATLNGNWYTITWKGLMLLRKEFPNDKKIETVITNLFDEIFDLNKDYISEINLR